MPDPLEPGHMTGQNPDTPERLQGKMKIGSRPSGSFYAIVAAILFALSIGAFLMFGSAATQEGQREKSDLSQAR